MKEKRILGILISLVLMMGTSSITFAATGAETQNLGKAMPSKVLAYVKPIFVVQLNERLQIFKDANGQRVYPLVYNGSTYLPVRAISALMDEDIEWDNYSRTVYIGKTLNNPNKIRARRNTENQYAAQGYSKQNYIEPTWKSAAVTVKVRPDIIIMYDFEVQNFTDESGNEIYPIVYNESTYLPVRAISVLMKEPIKWNNINKTILIGKGEIEENEEENPTIYTKRIKAEFESAIELYDQATIQVTNIQKSTDSAVKVMIANSITSDLQQAEKQTITIRNMKKSKMSQEEKDAQKALYDFVKISEHYLLVLENIAHMAAEDKDYSMLSDTFLNFAMDSQQKMNVARGLIEGL